MARVQLGIEESGANDGVYDALAALEASMYAGETADAAGADHRLNIDLTKDFADAEGMWDPECFMDDDVLEMSALAAGRGEPELPVPEHEAQRRRATRELQRAFNTLVMDAGAKKPPPNSVYEEWQIRAKLSAPDGDPVIPHHPPADELRRLASKRSRRGNRGGAGAGEESDPDEDDGVAHGGGGGGGFGAAGSRKRPRRPRDGSEFPADGALAKAVCALDVPAPQAQSVSRQLLRHAHATAKRLALSLTRPAPTAPPLDVREQRAEGSGTVVLSARSGGVPGSLREVHVNRAHYAKLRCLYAAFGRHAGLADGRLGHGRGTLVPGWSRDGCVRFLPSTVAAALPPRTTWESWFRADAWALLHRYGALEGGGGGGMHAALNEACFRVLRDRFGCAMECFASPLNCHFPRFCSPFPDTDRLFGSVGSFFDFSPTQGCFEANPPFEDSLIAAMATRMQRLLGATEQPLGFIVVVPCWTASRGWKALSESSYCRHHLRLGQEEHGYCEGKQHARPTRYRIASFDTSVFFLFNAAAAARWPVAAEALEELREAFRSRQRDEAELLAAEGAGRGQVQRAVRRGGDQPYRGLPLERLAAETGPAAGDPGSGDGDGDGEDGEEQGVDDGDTGPEPPRREEGALQAGRKKKGKGKGKKKGRKQAAQ